MKNLHFLKCFSIDSFPTLFCFVSVGYLVVCIRDLLYDQNVLFICIVEHQISPQISSSNDGVTFFIIHYCCFLHSPITATVGEFIESSDKLGSGS